MFAARGSGVTLAVGLLRALRRASERVSLTEGACDAASGGWGYAISLQGRKLYHYRSRVPVHLDDKSFFELLRIINSSDLVYGLVHAWLGGRPFTKANHVHPYEYRMKGCRLFLAYEGGIDSQRLVRLLGHGGDVEPIGEHHAISFYLSKMLESDTEVHEAFRAVLRYAKTVLNVGLLLSCESSTHLYAAVLIPPASEGRKRARYGTYLAIFRKLVAVYPLAVASKSPWRFRKDASRVYALEASVTLTIEPGKLSMKSVL